MDRGDEPMNTVRPLEPWVDTLVGALLGTAIGAGIGGKLSGRSGPVTSALCIAGGACLGFVGGATWGEWVETDPKMVERRRLKAEILEARRHHEMFREIDRVIKIHA